MVYILVLFGSFFGICAILGARIALKNRNVRRFVRGVSVRTEKAVERGLTLEETQVEKENGNGNGTTPARKLQELRTLLRQSEMCFAQKRYEEVERLLIQALTALPESKEAKAELAKLYLKTCREAKAEAMYRELLSDTDDVSFHANLGLACYVQGKYGEACASYAGAMERDPKNPERAAALGRACIAAQRYNEAAPLLEKATEWLARDTALMHLLAECYVQLGHPGRARETYQKINRLKPYDKEVKEKIAQLAGSVVGE